MDIFSEGPGCGMLGDEPGYFYIYLSNDGTEGGEAFFDDFTILTLESYIVQQTDYYPYGLIARNFVRAGEKESRELFQGKTYEELTGWHDFHARQYDAALGRWFGVDPQDQFGSPYLAMGNNPVMMVDPDGELAWFVPIIIGAVVNTALNAKNINSVWDALGYAAVGAAAGALGGGLSAGISSAIGGSGFGAGFSAAFSGSAGLAGSGLSAASSTFLSGAAIGGGAGFGAGFISGFGNSMVAGSSLGQSLSNGINSGWKGGLAGGIIGGSMSELERIKYLNMMKSASPARYHTVDFELPRLGGGTMPGRNLSYVGVEYRGLLPEFLVTANYYERALAFEGIPYLKGGVSCEGLDCSGLVNLATGHQKRVWDTSGGNPPGNWSPVTYNTSSHNAFIKDAVRGDLFLWKGHTAFSAGGVGLFHASSKGVGFTNDLLMHWLPKLGFPKVFRQY